MKKILMIIQLCNDIFYLSLLITSLYGNTHVQLSYLHCTLATRYPRDVICALFVIAMATEVAR